MNLAIIGCGIIGQRHFESVLDLDYKMKIFLIDKSAICLEKCKKISLKKKKINTFQFIKSINEDYDCTVACTEDLNGLRRYHPTCMAINIKQKEILKKYLSGGGRKIMPWVNSQNYYNILFTRERDFANLNTYKELKNLE